MRRHDIDPAVLSFLERSGLVRSGAKIVLTPLAGGVASDIWEVEAGSEPFVVKRALARLRVEQEWTAPVSRSASEVAGRGRRGASFPAPFRRSWPTMPHQGCSR